MEQGVVARRATRAGRRGSPRLEPDTRFRAQVAQVVLLPVLLGLACHFVARVLPAQFVWPNAAQALLLTAPRWLMLLWLLGAVGLLLRTRRVVVPALLAVSGLALAGLPPLPGQGTGLVFVSANVQAYGETRDGLETALGALDADVLITIERRAEQVPGMDRIADNHEPDLSPTSHGTAVFCKPTAGCEAVITEEFGSETSHMPLALVRVQGVCLLGVHGPPPVPFDATGLGPYVARIADALADGRMVADWGPCRAGDPALVAGDLNAVPGSGPHRLLRSRGLTDVVQHQGVWAGTWPAGGGWPDMPFLRLDHLLAGAVEVDGVTTRRLPGTDHKALRARVRPGVMLAVPEETP